MNKPGRKHGHFLIWFVLALLAYDQSSCSTDSIRQENRIRDLEYKLQQLEMKGRL